MKNYLQVLITNFSHLRLLATYIDAQNYELNVTSNILIEEVVVTAREKRRNSARRSDSTFCNESRTIRNIEI